MKVTLALLLLLLACGGDSAPTAAGGRGSEGDPGIHLQEQTSRRAIRIKIDMKSQRQLQREVDDGHQPWRLEPIDVAVASIAVHGHEDVDAERCSLVLQKKAEATVACRGRSGFVVKLKRLVKPNGIWTAVEIQITP